MLGAVAVVGTDVAAREQMLVHANGALVLTPAAKQIAQREMQLRGVGVILDGFNEGVDGLVLLLIEQEVQPPEIGFGRLPVLETQLTHIEPRCQPPEHKGHGQAHQDQSGVKVHGVPIGWRRRWQTLSSNLGARAQQHGAGATSAAPCPAHRSASQPRR